MTVGLSGDPGRGDSDKDDAPPSRCDADQVSGELEADSHRADWQRLVAAGGELDTAKKKEGSSTLTVARQQAATAGFPAILAVEGD